jgi:hypothetical protein
VSVPFWDAALPRIAGVVAAICVMAIFWYKIKF